MPSGYPAELTSNYVRFSREAACDPKKVFSLPGCPDPSWERWRHRCYKLVTRDTGGGGLEDSRKHCRELGGYLLVMRNDTSIQETMDFLINLAHDQDRDIIWVDHPLTYGPKGVGQCDSEGSNLPLIKSFPVAMNHTRHTSCNCSALSVSGSLVSVPCSSPLAGVCVTKHCSGLTHARQTQDCCDLSEAEAADWGRRVQGLSLVLRPGQVHQADEVSFSTKIIIGNILVTMQKFKHKLFKIILKTIFFLLIFWSK